MNDGYKTKPELAVELLKALKADRRRADPPAKSETVQEALEAAARLRQSMEAEEKRKR